jgi:AcrR family transcriptional regulator
VTSANLTRHPGLLEGVKRLLAEQGFADVTMEDIAREAGVSRMTLHRWGATREAILDALRADLAGEEREALWSALVADGSAVERLELALRAECGVAESNLDLMEALAADARDALYHEQGSEALTRAEFTAPLRRLLLDGCADGTLRAAEDVDETATVLYNLVGWTYHHLRRGHRWSPARAEDAVVDIALRGVAA